MEFFHETNQEKFLWLGFNEKYGWVILDRLLPANKSGHRKGEFLYFIKCLTISIIFAPPSNFMPSHFVSFITFLQFLSA